MSGLMITRRAALAGFAGFAVSGLSGCNTPQAPAVQTQAAAASNYQIAVDTTPLAAQSGNPTAQWAQEALPGALAQTLSSQTGGGTLSVRIDSIYLGGGGPADPDIMRGVATLNGRRVRVRATATYIPSPTDQALPEQALHGRVNALSQAFAYWLARKL